jgi:hypothetical protein
MKILAFVCVGDAAMAPICALHASGYRRRLRQASAFPMNST